MISKGFVHLVQHRFPKICHHVVGNPLLVKVMTVLDRPRFILNLLLNRPYIGDCISVSRYDQPEEVSWNSVQGI